MLDDPNGLYKRGVTVTLVPYITPFPFLYYYYYCYYSYSYYYRLL